MLTSLLARYESAAKHANYDYATIKPKLRSEHAMLTKSVTSVTSVVR